MMPSMRPLLATSRQELYSSMAVSMPTSASGPTVGGASDMTSLTVMRLGSLPMDDATSFSLINPTTFPFSRTGSWEIFFRFMALAAWDTVSSGEMKNIFLDMMSKARKAPELFFDDSSAENIFSAFEKDGSVFPASIRAISGRSEERRVGKER